MKYDVAVIGAGPAGSASASMLSSLGYRTLIIDPCNKKKVCAGILTAQYVRKYRKNDDFVERELKGSRISFRDIHAEITYRRAAEYSINRESYDRFNLNEAIIAGSELRMEKVSSIEEKISSIMIRTNKEPIITDYAIIASGISDLSQLCGGTKKYAFCMQQKKYIKPGDYYEIDLKPGSYSWSAPKKDYVLTGSSSLEGYPDIPGEKGLIPFGPVKKTFSKRFLLAGDAAGFVSPFEGEGLYYSRRSGELAAETLSNTMSGKNMLSDYQIRWKKEFDFSALTMISSLISNSSILEAFVRSARDSEEFNIFVENILTGDNKKFKIKEICFLIKMLSKNLLKKKKVLSPFDTIIL
ncbi:MAG: NAD(P)/FAD-dependent oxidoreductase [Candidatus Methanoperedens sp.]|nr:NAD(P)/FAD-dependent oxidoreductase [Candidatus Methanoperedens sp.]MCE8427269.1 NAD(P)/FAD-dependent oxidoreductase [Candidatus Methanoperedens sp.]